MLHHKTIPNSDPKLSSPLDSSDKENLSIANKRSSPRLASTPKSAVIKSSAKSTPKSTTTKPSTQSTSTSAATKPSTQSTAKSADTKSTPNRTSLSIVRKLRAGLVIDSTPTTPTRRPLQSGQDELEQLASLVGDDFPTPSKSKLYSSTVNSTSDSPNSVRTLFAFEQARSLTKFMKKHTETTQILTQTASSEPTQPDSPFISKRKIDSESPDVQPSAYRRSSRIATTPKSSGARIIVDLSQKVKTQTPNATRVQRKLAANHRLKSVTCSEKSDLSSEASITSEEMSDDDDSTTNIAGNAFVEAPINHDIAIIADHAHESDEEGLCDTAHDGLSLDVDQIYSRYFREQVMSKSSTSNNTLSKLPVLESKRFYEILATVQTKHAKELELLHHRHQQRFGQWSFELHQGFNMLFYGFGSKRDLIEEFAAQCLSDYPILIVNGLFPTISLRDILSKVLNDVIQHDGQCGSLFDQVSHITSYFSSCTRQIDRLYLVIHNIDGINLRNEKTHTALSRLAECRNIYMLASVDHINAGLLWDTVKMTRFNWLWQDATTFASYIEETSFENSMMLQQSEIGLQRTLQVLRSLTVNVRKIYRILIDHQITANNELAGHTSKDDMDQMDEVGQPKAKQGKKLAKALPFKSHLVTKTHSKKTDSSIFPGLSFQLFYQQANEQFLTNNETTFRTQLTEFRDHSIVKMRTGSDGTEMLYIPLATSVLCQLSEDSEW
ncbi:Origin recognition complex subunit 2 [Batrachochytrium dendrobatidis]|nr:Origin recognition complex subunit 2 [Batrachochytrium dendrobatidis]KAK5671649.1 Origin recognition complex subunit 2 [Batrachochytrium dendrobatidis]